jgi:hypothetical protein
VALHGGGAHVLAPADVLVERRAEVDFREGGDGWRDLAARGLDGDVLIRVEVDARVLVVLERGGAVGGGEGVGVRERVRLAVPRPWAAAGAAPAAEGAGPAAARAPEGAAAGGGRERRPAEEEEEGGGAAADEERLRRWGGT